MIEYEQAVIGALFIDTKKALPIASSILKAEDFGEENFRKIYEIATALPADSILDPVLTAAELEKAGCSFIKDTILNAVQMTPTASNVGEYAKLVKEDSQKRKLRDVADKIQQGYLVNSNWQEMASEAASALEGISKSTETIALKSSELATLWADHYELTTQDPEHNFCPSCFKSLDNALGGGFFRSGFYIIGARPGMGKTTFALNVAEKMVSNDKPVLFISLEMSSVQIMAKRIALSGRVNYTGLMNGNLSQGLQKLAMETCAKLSQRPFYCIDKASSTVAEIEMAARQIEGLKCIFIDYLGLIPSSNPDAKLYEQVTQTSKALKQMAMRLNIPVIVLCQLNRESVKEKDKRPKLADLRDSGAIEQDADGVLLLYREDYFNKDAEASHAEIEIEVAKHRHAASNITVKMSWVGSTGQIDELQYDWTAAAAQAEEVGKI